MQPCRISQPGADSVWRGRFLSGHARRPALLVQALGILVVAGMLAAAILTATGTAGGAASPTPMGASLKGRLLVATSELTDPRFVQTVILMIHHDATGAMGLVINRPIGRISIAALLEQLGAGGNGVGGELRVHYGGPVERMQGFVLHSTEYTTADTHVVGSGIALTTDPEVLRAMGTGAGPRRSLFALGYAGWAPGQLEGEIKSGHWVDVQADEKIVFDENADKKWERAMARRVIVL